MKKYLNIIGRVLVVIIVFTGLILAIMGLLKPNETNRVRIGGQNFKVEKQTLVNGKCYYIYVAGSKVFCIPCEEDYE
jgi:hypothetical protein